MTTGMNRDDRTPMHPPAAYIVFEAISALVGHKAPEASTVGLMLRVLSLPIMAALAWWEAAHRPRDGQPRPGRRRGRAARAPAWSGTPRGTRASIAPGTASGESTGPKRTELPSDRNQQATSHVRVCAPFRAAAPWSPTRPRPGCARICHWRCWPGSACTSSSAGSRCGRRPGHAADYPLAGLGDPRRGPRAGRPRGADGPF
jgi:hypothetical protein